MKIDFFSRMVQLDLCKAADAESTMHGIWRWGQKFGPISTLVSYQGGTLGMVKWLHGVSNIM